MKAGLITSVTLHAVLLGFGLVSLSAPRAFEVADVESLPVDIIPIESITQIQQGDKKAPLAEKPAPVPTTKPDVVDDAQKVGDNAIDMDTPPTPADKPRPVKAAEAPPPSPQPAPKPVEQKKPEPVKLPEPKPEPVKTAEARPLPEPAPKPVEQKKPEPVTPPEPKPVAAPAEAVTPEPQPKQEAKPDPAPESAVAETPEAVKLPQSAPSPEARPQPSQAQAQAQPAKQPERKDAEKPAQQQASKPKSDEKGFNPDEVAALLNKEKAAGGGAKRSQQQAALGGDRTTGGSKLSQSEMDALRGQIQRCWNVPAGAMDAQGLKVSIQFRLDRSGVIEGRPEIISGGGSAGVERAAAESARRAVLQCAPYNLPADKYDAWAEVIVHFDPSEMF